MLKGFQDFIARGNVVDLAVAVVIGTAFAALVSSMVADLLTPVIAAIIGEPDFSGLTFTINDSTFSYGSFINALITFLTVAIAVYFLVILPLARIKDWRGAEAPSIRECPQCLSEVPVAARRCAYCTSELAATQ